MIYRIYSINRPGRLDLNSCVGSLLAVGLVVLASFRMNEEG